MSWQELIEIKREARQMAEEDRAKKPVECPLCGQRLEYVESKAVYHCIFDGYITNGN